MGGCRQGSLERRHVDGLVGKDKKREGLTSHVNAPQRTEA